MRWRIQRFAKSLWIDQHLYAWITNIMIMIHIGLGLAIIAGGLPRFSIPSYQPLVDYTHGQVWIWGVWISLSAVLMSVPFRWPNIVGLWIGMFWHIIWMSCFMISVLRYDTSAATPVPVYGGLAALCAALLTLRVIHKTEG